ncbi:MAG TPA: hypothetical protein VG992_02510 [Candidatus Saccharimonadales bacterium]|nr:hypothetical protein [Candidatus Saccharimonadales bacterium]
MSGYIFFAELIPSPPILNDTAWLTQVLNELGRVSTCPIIGSDLDDPQVKTISMQLDCEDTADPEMLLTTAVEALQHAVTLAGTAMSSIVRIDAVHSDLLNDGISPEERDAHVIDLTDLYMQRQLSA